MHRCLQLVVFGVVFCVLGCSQVPKPSTYPMSFQKKMQSLHHWDVLAQDVADQVRPCLSERQGCELGQGRGVYVALRPGDFGEAFRNLLISHLVRPRSTDSFARQGCIVLEERTEDCLVLQFKAQVVRHRGGLQDRPYPGLFTVLATGISVIRSPSASFWKALGIGSGILLDIEQGASTSLPQHEVLVTASIIKENQYVFNTSNLYYINDGDWMLYPTAEIPDVASTKRFQVQGQ